MPCSVEQDEKAIPLSALQHYAYCPRQCALIHNEQAWLENWFTAKGQILHQRVDRAEPETRKGIRFERGVLVESKRLGLTGKLDLLEIEIASGQHTPVEYKSGKTKIEDWDRIQVCAQAICLEDMLSVEIPSAALWYWRTRKRENVLLDDILRAHTLAVIESVRVLLSSGTTPNTAAPKDKCQACSLIDLCQPDVLRKDKSRQYWEIMFEP